MNDVVQARGKLDLDNLEMTIDLHDQPVNAALMKATIINIQQATVQGRDTSLVALNVKSCTLPNEKWGRVPRLNWQVVGGGLSSNVWYNSGAQVVQMVDRVVDYKAKYNTWIHLVTDNLPFYRYV